MLASILPSLSPGLENFLTWTWSWIRLSPRILVSLCPLKLIFLLGKTSAYQRTQETRTRGVSLELDFGRLDFRVFF